MGRSLRLYWGALGVVVLLTILGGALWERDTSLRQDAPEVFMWTGANHLLDKEPAMFRSMLHFARRHDIIPYESGANDTTSLRRFLEAAQSAGIERTWIEIGPDKGVTAEAFATDSTRRASTLERFRNLARVYKAHYPAFARVTIFDEAPLGAFASASPDGKRSYLRDLQTFRTYGPEAFAYMYRAFKEVMPEAEVGVFLHHPHNASEVMAGQYSFIEAFMKEASAHGGTPDFIYSDVYRGYFNRGFGIEQTNAYITDVVAHTRKVARQFGVEAYQLGQVHTIKLGYTPSRWEIDSNVEAMLAGQPDGIGWYWPNYASTNHTKGPEGTPAQPEGYDVSFDPFVPNSWGRIGPAGSLYGTSRDRFTYAYLRIKEAIGGLEPRDHFDLWVYGQDFDHVEHEVYLRTSGSEGWVYLGAINPQQDRRRYVEQARPDHIYSYNDRWHAVVFHGLERERFLGAAGKSATLQVRIETNSTSDTSKIAALYAMPYRPTRNYATEAQVTRLIEQQPRWITINSLAYHVRPEAASLRPNAPFVGVLAAPEASAHAGDVGAWRQRVRGE